MALSNLPKFEQAKLLRRFVSGVEKQLKPKHPELISLTIGHRERGGEIIESELTLKAVVVKKKDNPAIPLKPFVAKTCANAVVGRKGLTRMIELPVDVVSFPDAELTSAANVLNGNKTGCLAGRILWENGERAWLTVSHLLKFPGTSHVANELTVLNGAVKLPRAQGALWLDDPKAPGCPVDATVVLEKVDMQMYSYWTAANISSIYTKKLIGLSGFRFIDQNSITHALKFHTSLPAGTLRYSGGYFPEVHLFQSNYTPCGGDSGGPVWIESEGEKKLVGIQSAVSDKNFVVIPIASVSRAFRNSGLMSGIWLRAL